jgi:HSP20 family molecular chaperone IbpA
VSDSTKDFDPFNFDWDDFKDQFSGKRSNKESKEFSGSNLDLGWLENYIQGALTKAMPDQAGDITKGQKLRHQVFETHDYMISRVAIPDEIDEMNLKVFIDTNRLILTGLPDNKTYTIQLPMNGRYAGSKATAKDQILEIRVPKESHRNYREIDINFF